MADIKWNDAPQGITWDDAPQGIVSGNMSASPEEVASGRQKFMAQEGTIGTRIRNTPAKGMAYNALMEIPRFAQEVVTVPINAGKRAAAGLGNLVEWTAKGVPLDDEREQIVNKWRGWGDQPLVNGPMDPSMTGELIGKGLGAVGNTAENLTGNTGVAQAGIDAALNTAAIVGGVKGAKATGKLAINAVPATFEMSMYKRGLKGQNGFTGLKKDVLDQRLNTALDEGIPLNPKGVDKLYNTVGEINQVIKDRITEYANDGRTVNIDNAVAPVGAVQAKSNAAAFNAKSNRQIRNTVDEFVNNRSIEQPGVSPVTSTPATEIPISQAQGFKQSINRELQDFYDAMNKSPDKGGYLAKQWVMKTKAAIGDGLRAEISRIFPEVRALNAREGALLELNKSLERAVNRIGQRDIMSMKFIQALVHSPKTAVVEFVLNNPNIQSNLAIAIRSARNKVNDVAPRNIPELGPIQPGPLRYDPEWYGGRTRTPTGGDPILEPFSTRQRTPMGGDPVRPADAGYGGFDPTGLTPNTPPPLRANTPGLPPAGTPPPLRAVTPGLPAAKTLTTAELKALLKNPNEIVASVTPNGDVIMRGLGAANVQNLKPGTRTPTAINEALDLVLRRK